MLAEGSGERRHDALSKNKIITTSVTEAEEWQRRRPQRRLTTVIDFGCCFLFGTFIKGIWVE